MSEITLHCGDCLGYMPAIPDCSIDLVLTDPPYPKEFSHLWEPIFKESSRILVDRGNLITLLGHYQVPFVMGIGEKYLRYWWILWMTQSRLNRLIGKGVAVKGKPALWFVKNRRRDIREYGYPFDTLESNLKQDKESKELHKWGQSVGWFEHYIGELTKSGETVFDPCMGSGAVAIACLNSNRNFIGCEIDPEYFAIAEKRINDARDKLSVV